VETPPTLRWGDRLAVSLHCDTRTWVVYNRSERAVCVEPQTAPPNSLNADAPEVIRPGDSRTLTLSVRW
jgi:aldose 1-epimerase